MLNRLICTLIFSFAVLSIQAQVEERIEPHNIRTIEFKGGSDQSQLPIINLGERLTLSFDDINGNEEDYYYQITHYDFDWTPSDLSKGEYLDGFDDVRIVDYENSYNTLQIYSHYYLNIPNRDTRRIQKSGNYLLSIFSDNNDLIFSRKFLVVENLVSTAVEIKRARDLKLIREKQVVQFEINSPDILLINPKQNVKTVVLQNSNLKEAKTDLIPQYTLGSKLIYRYDRKAAFWGGNEFLYFDNKDVRSATNGVRRVEVNDIYENYLYTNISRKDRPYTYNPDINGNFEVRNIDVKNSDIEAEYVRMYFNLMYYEDLGDKEIHLYGNFNNWTIDGTTFLEYDQRSDSYKNTRLFKQGFYNYKYVLVNRDGSIDDETISGNFWETENDYTVLVYYRAPGARFDRLIGMGSANSTNITNN